MSKVQNKALFYLILTALVVAVLAMLRTKLDWLSALCGALGDGCHDTEQYKFFTLSIAPLGVIYYTLLAFIYLYKREVLFYFVMIGFGVEILFFKTMIIGQFFCVFCVINLLLVTVVFGLSLNRTKAWQSLALVSTSFLISSFALSGGDAKVLPEQNPVVAKLGKAEILMSDLEKPLVAELYKLRQKEYQLKSFVLENKINDLLLEEEAKVLDMTVDELLLKVRAKAPAPKEYLVEHYYESGIYKTWGKWQGSKDEVLAEIRKYLHHKNGDPLVLEYYQKLRKKYFIENLLAKPTLPTIKISLEGAPSMGVENAQVVIVELSDYHCPSCRKGHSVVKKIQEKYKGQVKWFFKDYPLAIHPEAKNLALMARAAHQQGQFWKFHEALFSTKKKPSIEEALVLAEGLGLDMKSLEDDMNKKGFIKNLEDDIIEVRRVGIASTPSFIINGQLHSGTPSFEEFSKLIDERLKLTKKENIGE